MIATKEKSPIPQVDDKGRPVRPLPEIEDGAGLVAQEIALPPVLIDGLLHLGSKMVIGGGSKSFKTWTLLDLAISVATGENWWGKTTQPGRVLYVNLELARPHFALRLKTVLAKRGLVLKPGEANVWNLRGYGADLTLLKPRMLDKINCGEYSLIILDPIYKCLGNRDENKAGDIATLMNELEALAVESGAAVAFGAHFSKGNQSGKDSIDRIGGSGVFARDPDAILVMTRHEQDDAYVIESTLRNFPPLQPFCVRWEYPLMVPAPELNPESLKQSSGRGPRVPTDEEFLGFFVPDWPPNDPRFALLSHSELTMQFKARKFDKDSLKACRDGLEAKRKVGVIRGLPHNEVLTGLPGAVKAYLEAMPDGKRLGANGRAKRGH